MSWNKRFSIVTLAALIALVSVPSIAHAQRGGRGGGGRSPAPRIVVTRPVVVPRVYTPFYSPFYGPYYNPFFMDFYGWGFPGWGFYGAPGFYGGRGMVAESSARVQVTPRETEVYVDGYKAGVADDFDGVLQRLRVPPGPHVIELYLDGHKPITQTIDFQPAQSYRIKHAMEALADGDAVPQRPTPKDPPAGVTAQTQRRFDAFGQPYGGGRPAAGIEMRRTGEAATLAIRVQPGDASILVDGEHWQGSGSERLEIQVSPGEHRIEVQKDGYQSFTSTVRIRPGETNTLNVSLSKSGDE